MIVFDLDNTLRNTEGDYPHTPFAHGETCDYVQSLNISVVRVI